MTNPYAKEMVLLYSITDRGRAQNVMQELSEHQIMTHFQSVGVGTATSDMMDLLGLGSSEKDIVFSLTTRPIADDFMSKVDRSVGHLGRGRGLIVMLPLSAIGRMAKTIIIKNAGETAMNVEPLRRESPAEEQGKAIYSLIVIVANQGHVDDIMQTARKAGATGGTVIRARLVDPETMEMKLGIALDSDREIVTILCTKEERNQIMDAVNEKHGLSSKAQAILLALPVEDAHKL